jgi:hypothetical protein
MKNTPQECAKTSAFTFGVCHFFEISFDIQATQEIDMSMVSISPKLLTSSANNIYGLIVSSEKAGYKALRWTSPARACK